MEFDKVVVVVSSLLIVSIGPTVLMLVESVVVSEIGGLANVILIRVISTVPS